MAEGLRGSDDVEELLHLTKGERPDPEFVSRLRSRVLGEHRLVHGDTVPVLGDSTPLVDVQPVSAPAPSGRPLLRRVLAIAAVVILVAGIGYAITNADSPGVVEIADPGGTSLPVSSGSPDPEEVVVSAPPFDPSAVSILALEVGATLEPGSYRLESLGTPLSFETEEPLLLREREPGFVALSHPKGQGADERDITFFRLSEFSDPSAPTVLLENPGDGWPANDLAGWLNNMGSAINVQDRGSGTLGGRTTQWAEFSVVDAECSLAESFCVLLGTSQFVEQRMLKEESIYRLSVIDQPGQEPIAVIAAVNRPVDVGWFDTADKVLSTVALGDVAPSPLLKTRGGVASLPFVGGVEIDVPNQMHAVRLPGQIDRLVATGWDAEVAFLSELSDLNGNRIQTADQLLGLNILAGFEVVEGSQTVVGGLDARMVDVVGDASQPVLRAGLENPADWLAPRRARLWLIDHPEQGLVVISAQARSNSDIAFPVVSDLTDLLLPSLRFDGV